jgi:hypothetical protein
MVVNAGCLARRPAQHQQLKYALLTGHQVAHVVLAAPESEAAGKLQLSVGA